MKKLKLFFSMLMLIAFSVGNVWADPVNVTINFGTTTGYWAAHTNASYTDSDSRAWTRTCSVSNMSGQAGYSQFGNASNTPNVELYATAGSDMTVSAFSVTMVGASGGNSPTEGTIYLYKRSSANVDTQLATASANGTTSVTCSITSSVSFSSTDKLVVAYTGSSKAIRVNNLSYSYTTGGGSACAIPTFSPAAGAVLSGTNVSLTTSTAEADIYYTMGEDPADPTFESTKYTEPISITEATTIKAIAVKEGLDASEVASASYTLVEPLATMQGIFEAASTAGNYYITFSDAWVVTGVSSNGKTAYLSDGTKGLILYNKDNNIGLTAGKTLSGTKQCALTLYGGASEITSFTTDGLTIGDGELPAVQELDATGILNLSAVNTGSLIKISGQCTLQGSKYYIADVQLYNSLYAFNNPTANANYECTGVYVRFNSTNEICPRSADDLVQETEKSQANTYWNGAASASLTIRANESVTALWSTESTGDKHFTSSVESVATIAADGTITIQGVGTTVLTYTTDANNEFYAGTATLTLTVKAALPAGASEFTWVAYDWAEANEISENTTLPASIDANSYITMSWYQNENQNAPGYNANNKDARLYRYNSVKFDAKNGKLFAGITLNFRTSSVKGSDMAANCGTYNANTGEWSGLSNSVTITNTGTENVQANILSIEFVYLDGTVTTLSIANIALKTTDGATAIVPTCNLDPIPTIEYSGNDVQVATITDGKITPAGIGSTTVTARIAQGSNYTAAETTFTITVSEKQLPALLFAEESYNANLGADFSEPELVNTNNVSPITYSSSVAAVATVNAETGAITLVGEGETVITAAFAGDEDYSANNAQYTLHVIDPNKDVLTAAGIGKTSYEDWSKSFTTEIVYAGNSTTNANRIQLRVSSSTQDPSGIVTTSTIGYLKSISAAAASGNTDGHKLQIYAKNTAYESAADLYDAEKRGTLIGTIVEAGGNMVFEADKAYSDHYKYIGIKSASGAVYYDDITIAWTPVEFTTYSVTYQAGEGATGEEVVVDGIEDGATIQLAAKPEDFSKTDNVFAGWKLNNEGDALAAGSDYTVTGNATFVAQWSEAYTITYKAGDGEGDDVIVENVAAGAYSLAACPNTFEAPEGKIFAGWKLEDVEEDTRAAGSSYTVSGSVAFVAQWLTASVVTFDATLDISDVEASITKSGITVSASKFNNNEEGKYYYQCYANSSMSITSEVGYIIGIELTCTAEGNAKYGPGNFSLDGYSVSSYTGVWSGSAEAVDFGKASQQVRMTQIVVTYIPNGNTPKQPAGLSYETTSYEIYKGESFDAPTLNNPNELVVTYSGNNDEVATVNAETGAITLGEATGSVTITASAEAQGDYLAGTATYTLTVKEPIVIDDLTGTWTLVTDASQLIAGKKVIIASIPEENAAVTMSTTQAANNRIGQTGATISEGLITAQNGTAVFTLEAGTEENTLAFKSSSDEYLYAASSDKNYIRSQTTNDANGSWTISIEEGVATIVAQGENNHNVMRYNPNNGSPIFACYASTSTTGTLVTLYMLEEETPVEPTYETVRENLEVNRYYTMCLEKAVTAVQGASIWRVVSKAENNKDIILEEVDGTLDAGRPYIFRATAAELKVVYSGTTVEDPVTEGNNGLVGWFGPDDNPIEKDANNYIIYNNELYYVNSDKVYVGAHRAYLNMAAVPNYSEPQQQGAPRRRVVMSVHGTQTATGMDALNASDAPAKVLINGQLFILRGEKMYDAKGQLVK